MSRPDIIPANRRRGSSMRKSSVTVSRSAPVRASVALNAICAMLFCNTGTHRVALGVVAVEQTVGRRPVDHLAELPSKVDGILHAGVEALSTLWRMHVGGVAGEQDTSEAISGRLPGHVGEARDRTTLRPPSHPTR
jgi:hypothetical protein